MISLEYEIKKTASCSSLKVIWYAYVSVEMWIYEYKIVNTDNFLQILSGKTRD